jgi:hypothetical protein
VSELLNIFKAKPHTTSLRSNARRSLALWKAYIEFEAVQGDTAAAKRICYRAIAEIGTAKSEMACPLAPTVMC